MSVWRSRLKNYSFAVMLIITVSTMFLNQNANSCICDEGRITNCTTESIANATERRTLQEKPLFTISLFIRSAPTENKERQLIRDTWLSDASKYPEIVTAKFTIGLHASKTVQAQLADENTIHNDLLIFTDFIDAHLNLSLKTRDTMRHFVKHQINSSRMSYFVWTNSDSYLYLDRLVSFVRNTAVVVDRDRRLRIYGRSETCYGRKGALVPGRKECINPNQLGQSPNRKIGGKFYISTKIYPGSNYPHFIDGFTVLFGPNTIPLLLNEANNMTERYLMDFHVDDVLFTGILATKHDIELKEAPFCKYVHQNLNITSSSKKCASLHLRSAIQDMRPLRTKHLALMRGAANV